MALIHVLPVAESRRRDRRWLARPELFVFPALFLAQAAYSIYVGGDAWEWMAYSNRFLCVALPALLVFTSVLAEKAAQVLGPRSFARPAAVLLLLAVGLVMNLSPMKKMGEGQRHPRTR